MDGLGGFRQSHSSLAPQPCQLFPTPRPPSSLRKASAAALKFGDVNSTIRVSKGEISGGDNGYIISWIPMGEAYFCDPNNDHAQD